MISGGCRGPTPPLERHDDDRQCDQAERRELRRQVGRLVGEGRTDPGSSSGWGVRRVHPAALNNTMKIGSAHSASATNDTEGAISVARCDANTAPSSSSPSPTKSHA